MNTKYSQNSLQPLINGTGIVLHTGLGRSPINKSTSVGRKYLEFILTTTFPEDFNIPFSSLHLIVEL